MKKEQSDLRNQVKVMNATKAKMKELNKNTELCEQKDIELMCKNCDFRAETNNMLRKHINTKHPVAKVCGEDMQDCCESSLECSMCQDKFVSNNELNEHVEEHITEIKNIDVDDLKSGHKEFECIQCGFKAKDNDGVKSHLVEHAMQSYVNVKRITKTRKEKEQIIKAGSFRDLYNDEGDPLYDTADSEDSDSEM